MGIIAKFLNFLPILSLLTPRIMGLEGKAPWDYTDAEGSKASGHKP